MKNLLNAVSPFTYADIITEQVVLTVKKDGEDVLFNEKA